MAAPAPESDGHGRVPQNAPRCLRKRKRTRVSCDVSYLHKNVKLFFFPSHFPLSTRSFEEVWHHLNTFHTSALFNNIHIVQVVSRETGYDVTHTAKQQQQSPGSPETMIATYSYLEMLNMPLRQSVKSLSLQTTFQGMVTLQLLLSSSCLTRFTHTCSCWQVLHSSHFNE